MKTTMKPGSEGFLRPPKSPAGTSDSEGVRLGLFGLRFGIRRALKFSLKVSSARVAACLDEAESLSNEISIDAPDAVEKGSDVGDILRAREIVPRQDLQRDEVLGRRHRQEPAWHNLDVARRRRDFLLNPGGGEQQVHENRSFTAEEEPDSG